MNSELCELYIFIHIYFKKHSMDTRFWRIKESLTKSSQNCAEGSFEVFRGEREKERKKEREKEIKKERERERKKKIDRERVCV